MATLKRKVGSEMIWEARDFSDEAPLLARGFKILATHTSCKRQKQQLLIGTLLQHTLWHLSESTLDGHHLRAP